MTGRLFRSFMSSVWKRWSPLENHSLYSCAIYIRMISINRLLNSRVSGLNWPVIITRMYMRVQELCQVVSSMSLLQTITNMRYGGFSSCLYAILNTGVRCMGLCVRSLEMLIRLLE